MASGQGKELLPVRRIAGGGRRTHHHVLHAELHHPVGVSGQRGIDTLQGLIRETPRRIHALAQADDDVIAIQLVERAVRQHLRNEQTDGIRTTVNASETAALGCLGG